MNPNELFRAVELVAQTGGTPAQCEALAREAEALADMVGWANGPIDTSGKLLDRLASIQDDLRQRHAQGSDAGIAMLHDALTDLGRAIIRHDSDLDRTNSDEDEDHDFS